MEKELIAAEIGMPQIVTGILLVIGLIICWKELKKTMYSIKTKAEKTNGTFPDLPSRWLE